MQRFRFIPYMIVVTILALYGALISAWLLPIQYSTFSLQMLIRSISYLSLGLFSLLASGSFEGSIVIVMMLPLQALGLLGIVVGWSKFDRLARLSSVTILVINSVCGLCFGVFTFVGETRQVVECSLSNQSSIRIDTFFTGLDGYIYFVSHRPAGDTHWSTVFVRTYENSRALSCDHAVASTNDPNTQWVWIDADLAVTHDNGETWQVNDRNEDLAGRPWQEWSFISSVQFEDQEAGNLILTDRTRTQYAFYTQDGGVTWISLVEER